MRNSPQPSTRAASRYSSGIVRKNCRSRKIANASPNQFGMISGQSEPTRSELRPHHVERHDRHLRRQHQRDEDDQEHRVAAAPAQARERVGDRDARDQQAERRQARVDERVERPAPQRRAVEDVVKLLHWNGSGQSLGESACSFVISAVSATNTTGARNSAAAAISRLWSATATRKRRRRTARGGVRRTSARCSACACASPHRPLVVHPAARVARGSRSVSTNATPSSSIAIAEA